MEKKEHLILKIKINDENTINIYKVSNKGIKLLLFFVEKKNLCLLFIIYCRIMKWIKIILLNVREETCFIWNLLFMCIQYWQFKFRQGSPISWKNHQTSLIMIRRSKSELELPVLYKAEHITSFNFHTYWPFSIY